MKKINVQFDESTIKCLTSLIGKTFTEYKCDPFIFSNAVYGIVGVCADETSYAFTNFVESADYYGTMEDVAMFCMQEMPVDQMHSMIEDETLISTPVNSKIQSINIVNEHQRLFKNEVQTYDVMLTRGVIFETENGFEISLEKNVWFSEMITVRKGYHLIDTLSSPSDFAGEWEGEFRGKCTRSIITLQ